MHSKVLVLDFGSQFTQLITRRIRELNIYSEIHPFDYPLEKIKSDPTIKAIILSGGPNSIYEEGAPQINQEIFELGLPILGICYGMQAMANCLGGKVEGSTNREYGRAEIEILDKSNLLKGLTSPNSNQSTVWMSHGDKVTQIPDQFELIATTESCRFAAIAKPEQKLYGLQFHPEVYHTENGKQIIYNFLVEIAGLLPDWTSSNYIQSQITAIKDKVGDGHVLCGLSGGVDSSVAAALIHKAIGDQLHCVFVDHGLLRSNEKAEVEKIFRDNFQVHLTTVEAGEIFLSRLDQVSDPEEKRKIIGNTFIEVFEKVANNLTPELTEVRINKDFKLTYYQKDLQIEPKSVEKFKYLAQGTLYPDVVESVSFKGGPSHTIKSHHNVGGLPEKMNFKLIEPLRELFKDEVRQIGKELGLPKDMIARHPFPGPGLAIRIMGNIDRQKIETLQKADRIFIEELKNTGVSNLKAKDLTEIQDQSLYAQTWQSFCVLTNTKTVGVMGDGRTYEYVLAIRSVTATDGMTADWARLPYAFLARVSNRIINEVKGINRVVYDISSKPPATIEWE